MTKKLLKTCLLLLISGVTLTTITVLACGGGDWDGTEGSMFAPEIINQPKNVMFFRTLATPFYDGYDNDNASKFNTINVNEWQQFFENKTNAVQLNYWLYQANLNQIDSMIFALKNKPSNLSITSKLHTLKANEINTLKATAFLYYLGYAKRNETFVNKNGGNLWNTDTKIATTITIEKQITGGLTFYTKATDAFLKQRYFYQLVRLYFFNNEFDKGIAFYNENLSSTVASKSIDYRTIGYIAASLNKQKKYVQANYLYSKLFYNDSSLKKSAYLSFIPMQTTEMNECLNQTKSVLEKEVLWQLQGLYTNEVTAMKEILKLNPASAEVDLLMVRAINKEEENMEGAASYTTIYADENSPKQPVNSELLQFLNTMSDTKTANNPAMWHLAAAYLNYVSKNNTLADVQIKRAEMICQKNILLKGQYHLISALGKIKKIVTINRKAESDLVKDLEQVFLMEKIDQSPLRNSYAKTWMRQTLASLLIKNNEYEKAEMIYPGTYSSQYTDTIRLQKMIGYYEDKQKTDFEKVFLSNSIFQKENYQELLGIRYAQLDMLDASLKALSNAEYEKILLGNPFTIHIKDCHDCDHEALQKIKYSNISFIKKMIEMKTAANTKPSEAAQNYFLIANGFYNMTYFGNARMFYDNGIDNTINGYEHKRVPEENCEVALKYYLLAKQKSTDKEFKAKCTFMAAKCEQNAYYVGKPSSDKGDFKSGNYYTMLKKEYASTKYYSEIIKECVYFKTYLGK